MEFENFGLNVAKQRIRMDLSAYELSLRLGKDPSYVSKLESGKVNATLKIILAIAENLKIPPTVLFEEPPKEAK